MIKIFPTPSPIQRQVIAIRQTSFAAGQHDRDHPLHIPEFGYARLINGELRGAGICHTRRGSNKVVTKPETGIPQGMIFYEPTPGNGAFVWCHNGKFYKWENAGPVGTRIQASVQLANRALPVQFIVTPSASGQRIFCVAGTDDPAYEIDVQNGTAIAQATDANDFPRGKVGVTQAKRAIVGGVVTLPDSIIIGPITTGNAHSGNDQWSQNTDNLALDTQSRESVTAIAKYRDDQVLAFTRNSVHYAGNLSSSVSDDWFIRVIDSIYGTECPLSVLVSGDDAYFVSADKQLRTILRSELAAVRGIPRDAISHFNPNLFGRINQLAMRSIATTEFEDYILISGPFGESGTNNLVIMLDKRYPVSSPSGIAMPAVVGEITGWNVAFWGVATFGGRQRLYFLDTAGDIYEALTGETDSDGAGTNTYPQMQIDFRGMNFGTSDAMKTPMFGKISYERSFGTMQIYSAGDSRNFGSTPIKTLSIASGTATFPVTFPITFGEGSTDTKPFYFYGKPRSYMHQLRIICSGGPFNIKELSFYAKMHNVNKRQ